MKTITLFKTSLSVIYRHAVRSFLTVLGIMIGIAAIVVTFSIGRGAEARIRSQIMSLGENAIYIIPGNVMQHGHTGTVEKTPHLTTDDLYAITSQIDDIVGYTPAFEVSEPIIYGDVTAKERIMGTDSNILALLSRTMDHGIFFTDYHVKHRENVIVLGDSLAESLFKGGDPLGKVIRIKRIPFTVIGIVKYDGNFWGTNDPNKLGYMPYTTAKKYFKPDLLERDLDFIVLKLGNEKFKGESLRKVTRTLRLTRHIKPNEQDDFTIFDQQTIASSAETASRVIELFGLIAAFISLIVGGIGIMNIMLVSVQERTREIGIRLALGATQSMIQTQFIIEAVVLCTLGGIIGVIVGIGLVNVLSYITNLPGIIEVKPIAMALLVTILIGVFFGYYPARKASLLNPVDALYNI
jgi:putative ABC transport system permease protein